MQTINKVHRSSIFLLELMITILLFSVNSAVCIRVFGQAHQASRQAQMLTYAVGECSDVAEVLRWADSPEEAAEQLRRAYPLSSGDADSQTLTLENGDSILVESRWEAPMRCSHIAYRSTDGSTVYELDISRYFREVAP